MFGPSGVRGFAPNFPRPGRAFFCFSRSVLLRYALMGSPKHTRGALWLTVSCCAMLVACADLPPAIPSDAVLEAELARLSARERLEPLVDAVDRPQSFVPADPKLHPDCAVNTKGYRAFAGTYQAASFDIVAYLYRPMDEPVGSVLVLHGYLANSRHMCDLAQALLAADYAVLTPNLPGHGLSTGARGDIDDFSQYAAVVEASVDLLSEFDLGPTHAIGHSTGATALYEYLVHNSDPFEQVIFAAPLIRSYGYTTTRIGRILIEPFVDDIDTGYYGVLSVPRLPLSWFDALAVWNERAAAYRQIDRPILVLQGDRDRVVAWRRNRRHLQTAIPTMKYVRLPGYDHIVLSDRFGRRSGILLALQHINGPGR